MRKIELFEIISKKEGSNSLIIERVENLKNENINLNKILTKRSFRQSFEISKNKIKYFKDNLINLRIPSYVNIRFNSTYNNTNVYSYYNKTENPKFLQKYKRNLLLKRNGNNKYKKNMSLSIKKPNENNKKIKEKNKKDISKIKKEKIKLKIKILDNNIIYLEKALKLKNRNLLEMKLENERKNYKTKLSILKEQYKFVIQKYKKKIQTLKIKLINCEKKYINIKKFDENIYNEDLDFQNQKIKLLDELIEYRGLLSNVNSNDEKDEEYSNIIKDNSSIEKTIKEGSLVDYSKLDSVCDRESLLDEMIINDIKFVNMENKMGIFRTKFLENKNNVK